MQDTHSRVVTPDPRYNCGLEEAGLAWALCHGCLHDEPLRFCCSLDPHITSCVRDAMTVGASSHQSFLHMIE